VESLQKYVYEDGNRFSFEEYIRLAVFGYELVRKP